MAFVITGGIMTATGVVAASASSRTGCFVAVAGGYPPRHFAAEKAPAQCGNSAVLRSAVRPAPPRWAKVPASLSTGGASASLASLTTGGGQSQVSLTPAKPVTTPPKTDPKEKDNSGSGNGPNIPSLNPVVKLHGVGHSSGGHGHGQGNGQGNGQGHGSSNGSSSRRPVSHPPASRAPAVIAAPVPARATPPSTGAPAPSEAVAGHFQTPLSSAAPASTAASATPAHRTGARGLDDPMMVAGGPWPGLSLKTATRLTVPIIFAAFVGLFLLLQGLVDRRDPKVVRAPERGHDETVGFQ